MALVVYCADVGSVKSGNFGWARLFASDSNDCIIGGDITQFADQIAADLNAGHDVALGFECPLFVPVPELPTNLTAARSGEASRPWSAGAGSAALATGLTESVWILDRVRQQLQRACSCHTDWDRFATNGGLFVWEAFVTGSAKRGSHHDDAEVAVLTFIESLPNPERYNAIQCKDRVRSLIGAALLQTGWTNDTACLAQPCLVVRAKSLSPSPNQSLGRSEATGL